MTNESQAPARALEDSQLTAALELIFAGHPSAMWIFDQESLQFLTVNQAAIVRYGYSREEFLKMRFTDIAANEDIPAILHALARMQETQRPVLSCRHRLKNGRIVTVEMTTCLLMLGTDRGVLTVAQDITQRKADEISRQESSIYLRALTENCPLAIVVHDTDGRVLMCNPAFETLFQYRQDDIAGLQLDHLIVPEDRSAEAWEITRTVVAGRGTQLTTQRRRKDGTVMDIEIHGSPW